MNLIISQREEISGDPKIDAKFPESKPKRDETNSFCKISNIEKDKNLNYYNLSHKSTFMFK